MSDDTEVSEVSSESTGDTSVSEESNSQFESSGAETHDSAPETKSEERPAPFHEHPRFKELIDQNREFKQQNETYQQSLRALQSQMEDFKKSAAPKKEEPQDQFLADLEKVNPAYAKSLRAVYEKANIGEQALQRLQQMESQQFAQKAFSRFDNLMSSNKIEDPVDKEIYSAAVEAEVYRRESRGERLGLQDLDKIFNSFHAKYSKYNEDRERKTTARYVSAKKNDATPVGATGGAAMGSAGMKKFSSIDSPEAIKWLATEMRKNKKTV